MDTQQAREKLEKVGFTTFEGIKVAYSQDKNGHKITFRINDEDMGNAQAIATCFLGTRLMVAVAEINSSEETHEVRGKGKPKGPQEEDPGERAIKIAGMLCRDEKFRAWLFKRGGIADSNKEDETVQWLYDRLGIQSRRELANKAGAREELWSIYEAYKMALRAGEIG